MSNKIISRNIIHEGKKKHHYARKKVNAASLDETLVSELNVIDFTDDFTLLS